MIKHFSIFLFLALLVTLVPAKGLANANLFSKLEGDFRGTGMSVTKAGGKKQRVSCQLSNKYDKGSGKLKMKGKCASSRGSTLVRGAITHKNGKVSGTYIALRAKVEMLKSSGKSGRKSVTIFSSFRDKSNDKIYKIKQVLQLRGGGFQADFFTFDKSAKKYKSAGVMSFKRK
jgi:hypothetical protein